MFVVLCRYCQRNFNEDREGSKDVSAGHGSEEAMNLTLLSKEYFAIERS